jgi:DNA-binding SARP family transcriptional activator
LVELAPWLSRQLALALAEDIEAPAARALIAEFDLAPDDVTDANWPWPVKVRTLGAFQLELNGEAINFSGKAPKKTLGLLQAIIALGGHAVPESELIDALWPESEGDAGRQAMKIALLRLRKLLGAGESVEWQQGRLSLNARRIWVDAFAFEAAAERALRDAAPADLEAALRLYAGRFLPGDDQQTWPVLARERLARKFVQLVAQHGQALERRGDYDAAERAYLRGLDADALAEAFYQGLMRCHLARGQHAEGVNIFRRLRQQLSVTLSIDPSQESQALLQALQRPATAALRSS